MGKTRPTSISCTLPIPSSEYEILQIVSELVDEDVQFVKNDSDSKVSLVKTVKNNFTLKESSISGLSLMGCIRILVKDTEYYDNGNSSTNPYNVESWISSSESALLPILQYFESEDQEEEKTALFTQSLESFLSKLETYFFTNDQTYLVGDYATVADVVTAILLAQACSMINAFNDKGNVLWPQQCYRWGQTIVHQLEAVVTNATIPWKDYKKQIQEGTASPTEKPKQQQQPKKSAPAPAPAPAPTPAPTPASAPAPAPAPAPTPASAPVDSGDNIILNKLKEYNLEHNVYEHELAATAEELIAKVKLPSESETHTKNLFFKDKKHGMFLITVATNPTKTANVQTKELGKLLNLQGKTNLRLADAKILDEVLKVKPGCVGPLCIINNPNPTESPITLVLDKSLTDGTYTKIHSHPLRNDMSVSMTPEALLEYMKKSNVEPTILEFEASAASATTEKLPGKLPANRPPESKKEQKPKQQQKEKSSENKKTGKKGDTLLALQWKKTENFPMWYSDVIVLSEMIAYYDISGCYILRPWSYKIWELIQEWFNVKITELDVENAYFPLFVSRDRLEKEKDHVEGFAPEVAWVTRSGDDELAKPIAVRPTSETIMYPAFSDWIKSHRDLPLKLNQWSNVVRWEFKDPTPFLRSREFLWQEGHTAHSSFDEANVMVRQALELYRLVYEELLAVPVMPGYKTEKEKFAGGHTTTTVEAYIPGSGRAIQGATSHNLGQNFGKMFDIKYQDEKGTSQIAWQTSWGLTTRTIGVMVMVHGDDTGLVLPPRVAPLQAVIVPIVSKKLSTEDAAPYCEGILKDLTSAGIRTKYDDRTIYNPGWKYNHWEQKGVPIRIEVGPRDIEQKQARVVIRHNGEKIDLPVDGLAETLKAKLDEIQTAMFEKVKKERDSHVVQVTEWKDFVPNLELNNLVLTPWCGGEHKEWEEWVKTTSREESLKARGEGEEDERAATSVAAKTLCIPFDQPELPEGTKCIASGLPATCWVLWGRSY